MATYPRPKAPKPKTKRYKISVPSHWYWSLVRNVIGEMHVLFSDDVNAERTQVPFVVKRCKTDFMTGQKSSLAEASAEVVFEAAPSRLERSSSRTFRPNCNKLTLFWVLKTPIVVLLFQTSSLPRGFSGVVARTRPPEAWIFPVWLQEFVAATERRSQPTGTREAARRPTSTVKICQGRTTTVTVISLDTVRVTILITHILLKMSRHF